MLEERRIRYDVENSNTFKHAANLILDNVSVLWSCSHKAAPIVVSMTLGHQWRMGFITEQGHPGSKLQADGVLAKKNHMYDLQYIVLNVDLLPLWVVAETLSSPGLCSIITQTDVKG